MRARLALGTIVGMAAIVIAASTSRADPNLTNIPQHRHWIKTPDGSLVEVGPRLCDDPNLQRAFNQFHNNIHAVSPSGIGPAAPGLHNLKGADVQASGC